jgi:hypothetical protein
VGRPSAAIHRLSAACVLGCCYAVTGEPVAEELLGGVRQAERMMRHHPTKESYHKAHSKASSHCRGDLAVQVVRRVSFDCSLLSLVCMSPAVLGEAGEAPQHGLSQSDWVNEKNGLHDGIECSRVEYRTRRFREESL